MSRRHDLVIFGATGFTGIRVVELLLKSDEKIDFAIAGRNEIKLKNILSDISKRIGKDIRNIPIIIADIDNAESLAEMAKCAKVIINTVGPYRLYGEAVVKAAVENGASHVDVSGEPAFLESMQMKYDEEAKKKGVYIVGACGWDSIPCDLGFNFLKRNFNGQLNHAETFVQLNTGPAGYSFNAGTYQTLILAIANMANDGLSKIRRSIMPEKIPRSQYRPPKRGKIWYNEKLDGWCLPFLGSDKSIVSRSEYFNYIVDNEPPAYVETYFRIKSLLWTILFSLWLAIFFIMSKFGLTRKILQKYPDICSFNMFKTSGPTEEQIKQASFTYWFFGSGWSDKLPPGEQHNKSPDKMVIVRCDGPDAGYITTSACAISAALTLLHESNKIPLGGGAFTTAAIFKKTNIYERLKKFGVTFKVVENTA
uniref:Saccharopine dehydrogenase NADP binding domain-containing protein n=2 Tax=Parascaris univalens TaxID=6257 RepID=A0A914ZLJ2_PARUN